MQYEMKGCANMKRTLVRSLKFAAWASFLCSVFAPAAHSADLAIQNSKGIHVVALEKEGHFALGSISLNNKVVEAPLESGILALRNATTSQEVWLEASKLERLADNKLLFSGSGNVAGASVRYEVTVETPLDVKAVKVTYQFSADRDMKDWQAVLSYHSAFAHSWQCHIYPYAEASKYVQQDPLNYMGIPSLFLYRDDRAMGALWGIDMNSDYLNPPTRNWGATTPSTK